MQRKPKIFVKTEYLYVSNQTEYGQPIYYAVVHNRIPPYKYPVIYFGTMDNLQQYDVSSFTRYHASRKRFNFNLRNGAVLQTGGLCTTEDGCFMFPDKSAIRLHHLENYYVLVSLPDEHNWDDRYDETLCEKLTLKKLLDPNFDQIPATYELK
jgi:hypothetical protein